MEERASGIAATATATANINALTTEVPMFSVPFNSHTRPTSIAKIRMDKPRMKKPSFLLKASSLRCSGVSFASALSINSAILPISVFNAVPVTTNIPRPYTTSEPLKTIFKRSPMGASFSMDSVCFCAGSDSPVNIPSLIFKLPDSIIRPSAGT
ncbi:hypothetical protein D3C75_937190 [compost metagenome]